MKVTVSLSDSEMRDIQRLTGQKAKGPAIRELALEAVRLRARQAVSRRFATGEWAAELPDLAELRRDRRL